MPAACAIPPNESSARWRPASATCTSSAAGSLAAAKQALVAMSVGKADPRYADALKAVLDASGSLSGRDPITGAQVRSDYRGLDRELADGAARLQAAADQVRAAKGDTRKLAEGL